jgi:protein SCO1/2
MKTSRLVWAIAAIGGVAALSLGVMAPGLRFDTARVDRETAQSAARTEVPDRAPRGKVSDKFPNIRLITHDDKQVRFYDDLVKDKTVIINFMYTDCIAGCPLTTANLDRLYGHLRPRMGHDVLILSITLSGELDTPQALRMYADQFGGVRPGWLYLTGNYDEIDALRRTLGVYDLDPVVDANKNSHAGIITFGNDRTNRWAALPAMMDSRGIAKTVQWITRN